MYIRYRHDVNTMYTQHQHNTMYTQHRYIIDTVPIQYRYGIDRIYSVPLYIYAVRHSVVIQAQITSIQANCAKRWDKALNAFCYQVMTASSGASDTRSRTTCTRETAAAAEEAPSAPLPHPAVHNAPLALPAPSAQLALPAPGAQLALPAPDNLSIVPAGAWVEN